MLSMSKQSLVTCSTHVGDTKSRFYWMHFPLLRLLMAIPIAVGSTIILFVVMALMVDNGHRSLPEKSSTLVFDMFMAEPQKEAQRRQRHVPEKPQTLPPTQAIQSGQKMVEIPLPTMPSIGLDTAVSGLAVNIPLVSDFSSNQQALPLYRVEPQYPARAMKLGAQGFVLLSFTIDTQGRPQKIRIKESKPRRMFDKAAVHALKKWKYQPKVLDGKSIAQAGQTVRLEFKISRS